MLEPLLALIVFHVPLALATVPFRSCSLSSPNSSIALNISSVYAQLTNNQHGLFLNFTLLGQSPSQILDLSNTTNLLSTVFTTTKVLTFFLSPENESRFCSTLRPPSPLPPLQNPPSNYCPLSPGPFAFSVSTKLPQSSYQLVTLNTRIRVVDTSNPGHEIACVEVPLTPLHPGPLNSVYGRARLVFWCSVALAIAYWLVVGIGRLAAAWRRGRQRVHDNLWSHIQGVGFALASAISGELFASSPALMRFATPSLRDVIFHTQWCTLLAMVTVQWPHFAYPFFAQTAWATLLYNVTLTQGTSAVATHWDPLHAEPFTPPSEFADQLADPSSPLFVNNSVPNTFFSLPPGVSSTGIPALASAVGIRPQDAFGVALGLFLLILGATVILSVLIFAIDWLVGSILRASERRNGIRSGTKTPPWASASKELGDSPDLPGMDDELAAGSVRFLHRPTGRASLTERQGWLSQRLGQSSFHGSVLCGNLVRVLLLFHLPVTIFSCFQFSQGKSQSSLASVILAACAFAIISVLIPLGLVLRLTMTPTNKLYDEMRTLLALGPLYNHYVHGSQLFACLFFTSNIAYGVALGSGQKSGSAQAIIILVVEVLSALTTSVWLPWARGATMGGISFVLCVARIITGVLLVILSPIVSVGDDAGGWIAYAILFIQGLVYIGLFLMLLSKIAEGVVRIVGDVPFDRGKHGIDTGLLGAIALGGKRKRRVRAEGSMSEVTQSMLALPPVAPPASPGTASGPPSVLRPEQIVQPYREESDDEDGYILGAWNYEDDEGTSPPSSPPATSTAVPTPTSGFSRIAGGRANMESPYTMAPRTGNSGGGDRNRSGLPPGAMAPAHLHVHARKRSQSAIIDGLEESASPPEERARGKQPWFGLFGARTGHDSDAPNAPDIPAGLESESASPSVPKVGRAAAAGRSFVVIRERRPSPLSQTVAVAGDDTEDEGDGEGKGGEHEEAPRSFTVLRPSRSRGLH